MSLASDIGDRGGPSVASSDEICSAVEDYLIAEPDPDPSGPGSEVERRAWVRSEPGLAPELRNERLFVRVKLPMEVQHRDTVYPGFDISLGSFSVFGHPSVDDEVPPEVREIAWKAQTRLTARYRRLAARGKRTTFVCTAVARELVGFMWSVAHQVRPA
jgi:hypothetical protein